MRVRVLAAIVWVTALLTVGVAAPASAEPPVDLGNARVVDEAGVLSNAQEQQVESALTDLSKSGSNLSVVFVNTFTGASSSQGWVDTVAEQNGLGTNDGVLAVAVKDRLWRYAVGTDFPVSTSELNRIGQDDLVPQLKQKNWSAGAIAFVEGVKQAEASGASSGDGSSGSQGTSTGSGSSSSSGGLGGGAVFLLLIVVLGVVLLIVALRRRRRAAVGAGGGGAGAPPVAPPVDQKALDQKASKALIDLDDALTTSDQELGFAVAEFGEPATKDFRAALDDARAKAQQAFSIRQQLDDDQPETPVQRQRMTEQIIALCADADRELDAQTSSFDALRKLEQQLPTQLQTAEEAQHRLEARLTAAGAALDQLRAAHGPAATAGVADDLDQARSLVAFSSKAVEDAQAAQAAGRAGEAVVALRGAQQAEGQADALLTGVLNAGADFDATVRRLTAAVDDTRSDIEEARSARARAAADRTALDAVVRDAEQALATVATAVPAAALTAVEQANAKLNGVLGRIRNRDEQVRRAQAALPRVLDAAQQAVASTRRFIDTRRGGVGAEARTRIVDAQQKLDRAVQLSSSDPIGALAAAQLAQQRATEAYDLASQDVDDFRNGPWGGGGPGGGGWGGGYGGGGSGGAFGGAVLGGVLGGLLTGGRHAGGYGGWDGGWGGWGGGSGGGGGGFGGGGGGFGGGGGGGGGGFSGGGGGF
jgi:uncharacterized membrane protein YgcG